MKKILLGFALSLATLSFAQQYPNNGWGNDGYGNNGGYDDGYYSDEDDQNYFPDDYYYNYPQDYYPNDYYQTNYNDYRNSIISINWNAFFAQNRLNRWQIDQILRLNNLYVSFSAWNNFYRYNPDRWYYDRFYTLQRIMGPRIFVVFQNNYYRGYSPVVYFQNYRRTHYASICRPMPRYRNVNVNVYRVERNRFRQDNPTLNIVRRSSGDGFRGSNGNNGNNGFRGQGNNGVRNNSGGFRNSDNNDNNGVRSNGGFRGNSENNGGFRNDNGFRGGRTERREEGVRRDDNNGFRGNNNGGGLRQQKSESTPRIKNTPKQNNGNESRGGGFRQRLVKN